MNDVYFYEDMGEMSEQDNLAVPQGYDIVASHPDGELLYFGTFGEAERYTGISKKRIASCIRTGRSWRRWQFRLLDE